MPIRILPPELADQIAAGEVVERPASVVKELVENALDAGARRVEVEIERGGLGRIAVGDDGSGMSPEEAHLALKRHATSKLSAITDLIGLPTMGFRGEALPSIAAVSKLSLTTRTRESDAAYLLEVEAGVAGEGRAVGAPAGTQIEVRDLFANVPARLKFVKGEPTESAHVVDAVLRLALAFPSVHFRLRSDGRVALDLPPHATALERARAAMGKPRAPAVLHEASGEESGVRVEAYLGSPADSATTTRGTFLYVNRRFVRDRGLLHAVTMGYGELVERGRYPLAIVMVTVPGDSVDLNVHPQKLEVRFARAQEVYAAVRHAIGAACARAPWLSEAPRDFSPPAIRVYSLPPTAPLAAEEPHAGYEAHRRRAAEAMCQFAPPRSDPFRAAAPPEPAYLRGLEPAPAPPPAQREPERFFSSLVYLGQLQKTYLLCEAPGELVLIDQHAAHERVAFQRLREAQGRRQVRTQRLLLPATVELDESLAAVAVENAALLAELGFEVEPFGPRAVVVRALPSVIAETAPARVLGEVLGQLAADATTTVVSDRLDHVLATMACHSVVRAGDVLGEREVRALLESMDGIDYRAHCPHGRPVLLRLSIGEIERRFGR
jgi:DNA mismatch repair protein MutL